MKPYFETKVAAFKKHTTQSPLWPLFEENVRGRGEKELFHLAAAIKSGTIKQEADLFEGVDDAV